MLPKTSAGLYFFFFTTEVKIHSPPPIYLDNATLAELTKESNMLCEENYKEDKVFSHNYLETRRGSPALSNNKIWIEIKEFDKASNEFLLNIPYFTVFVNLFYY